MLERETATYTEDLPHKYRSAGNPGDRCRTCGAGPAGELHQVETATEQAVAAGSPLTTLQREVGS